MMQKQLSEFVLLLSLSDGTLYVVTITCLSERTKTLFTFLTVCLLRHDRVDLWTVNCSIKSLADAVKPKNTEDY